MNLVILTYRKLRTEQNEKFSSHFVSVTCLKKLGKIFNFLMRKLKVIKMKNCIIWKYKKYLYSREI